MTFRAPCSRVPSGNPAFAQASAARLARRWSSASFLTPCSFSSPSSNLLCHSDRGVEYASADYRQALARAGLVASMSRKGNCYDNAAMESFWSTLKMELVYRRGFATREQARTEIFEFIEIFHNRQHFHSAINFLSPVDFENLNN